jgi:hypothetical protein
VFQAPEITQAMIKSQAGSSKAACAKLGYCPTTYMLKQVVDDAKGEVRYFRYDLARFTNYA